MQIFMAITMLFMVLTLLITLLNIAISEFSVYCGIDDLLVTKFGKIRQSSINRKYIRNALKTKAAMQMKFGIFKELYGIKPSAWELKDNYVVYHTETEKIEVFFKWWEIRRYKIWSAHQDGRYYGTLDKIAGKFRTKKSEAVKNKIKYRQEVQNNIAKQMRVLESMGGIIHEDMLKDIQNTKNKLGEHKITMVEEI